MAKKLSELYAPKSKDEKAFVAKQTVKKTTDKSPSTKQDAVFTGSNVKTFDRSKNRMGYDAGDDEKQYDNGKNPGPNDMKDTEALAPYTVKEDELEEGNPVNKAKRKAFDIAKGKDAPRKNATAMKRLGRKMANEEAEDIELSEDEIDEILEYLGELLVQETEDLDETSARDFARGVNPNHPATTVKTPQQGSNYSKVAVDKAIASSNRGGRKIGGKEAKKIHALLKGWRG